tara:strand:+ start:231 stop:551 length:321 start_codon:yes stop_codon:yes gene_type:complete
MPENYSFVSKGEDKWASILITKGKYTGIIYQYGRVSVAEEENEDGNLPLSFDYNVIDFNGHEFQDLIESKEFKNTLGDILVEILDEQLDQDNLEYSAATSDTSDND